MVEFPDGQSPERKISGETIPGWTNTGWGFSGWTTFGRIFPGRKIPGWTGTGEIIPGLRFSRIGQFPARTFAGYSSLNLLF